MQLMELHMGLHMGLHNSYLAAISVLFVLLFAVMLWSLMRHRKPDSAPRFGGPTGRVQWLWALVPMAILGLVDLALIDGTGDRVQASIDKPSVVVVHR